MCVATGALILGGVGTAVSAGGAIAAGNARANAAQYQAQVARNNAIIANQSAEYASQAGIADAERQGMKNRATMGKIKAAQAANGIDINTGSPVQVRAGNAETGEQDVLTTLNNAQNKVYGYRAQAANDTAQGILDEQTASNDRTAGALGAATSLLGGASSLGMKWAGLQSGSGGTAGSDLGEDF